MRHALALAAIIALVCAGPAAGADDPPQRTLQLTGKGEVFAPPDMATIDIGVVSEADSARAALDANTQAMSQIMDVLERLEIAGKDIRTSGFSVQPRYHHDPRQIAGPRVVGYQVNNTVHVTVRRLDGLGRVLDQVVSGGSNTIQRLEFSFSEPERLMDEARAVASADAKRKAELFAASLGVKLGRIVSVVEADGGRPPMPAMMRAQSFEAADVPIAAGEQAVAASVSVTWEIE